MRSLAILIALSFLYMTGCMAEEEKSMEELQAELAKSELMQGFLLGTVIAQESMFAEYIYFGGEFLSYEGDDEEALMKKTIAVAMMETGAQRIYKAASRVTDETKDRDEMEFFLMTSSSNYTILKVYFQERKKHGLRHSDESISKDVDKLIEIYEKNGNAFGREFWLFGKDPEPNSFGSRKGPERTAEKKEEKKSVYKYAECTVEEVLSSTDIKVSGYPGTNGPIVISLYGQFGFPPDTKEGAWAKQQLAEALKDGKLVVQSFDGEELPKPDANGKMAAYCIIPKETKAHQLKTEGGATGVYFSGSIYLHGWMIMGAKNFGYEYGDYREEIIKKNVRFNKIGEVRKKGLYEHFPENAGSLLKAHRAAAENE